jgi:outer membrane murein-binding lipoprotein Lpp
MKTTLPLTLVAIIFSTILLSSGCQKKPATTNPTSENKSELHESTKPLQAADLVGYDGTKLRKSVHQIKDANEKHNQEIEKMVESGPDQ